MKIEMYTRDDCFWCVKAKELLREQNLNYTEYKIGKDLTKEEFKEKFPVQRTVPYIFVDSKAIGGYDNLNEWVTFKYKD
jgi:thioredoxin reductase (NADPH)